MIWAGEVDGLTSTTKLVLIALANRASDRGTSCFPSIPTIAAWCRLGDRAVQNAIKTLETEGYIRVERRPNASNNFTLLMDLKITATRSKPASPVVHESDLLVHVDTSGGARRADEPVKEPITQPVRKNPPKAPIGIQSAIDAGNAVSAAQTEAYAVETWNRICGPKLGDIRRMHDSRRDNLRARLKEFDEPIGEGWHAFCRRIARSPFLTGDNDRNWRPNFDWCLKPANFTKIIEGTYDDKSGRSLDDRPRRFIPSPGTI
jgi:hypothetical protein